MMEHYVTALQWYRGSLILACRCGALVTGERRSVKEWWDTHRVESDSI